jgi:hypothetical protein
MFVLCVVQQGQKAQPAQSGQSSSTDEVQRTKRNPAEAHRCLCLLSVLCCQVEVSATRLSFIQGNPTDCGVSWCVIQKPQE